MLCAEHRIATGFFPYEPKSPDAMIHNDHLATPQKMTDSSGTVVWAADYKPFGEATVSQSSTITNNLRFPGQYYDAETGLHYNYMRDYNPVLGRYVQRDMAGINKGTNHLYAYGNNNPLLYIDVMGLACTLISTEKDDWLVINKNIVYMDWIYDSSSLLLQKCWCNFHRPKRIDVTEKQYFLTKNTYLCKEKKCGKEVTYTKTDTNIDVSTNNYSVYGGADVKVVSGHTYATQGEGLDIGGGCDCEPLLPNPPGLYPKK